VGNFQGAKNWSRQALEDPPTWSAEAQASLVLAMSEEQSGETAAVRTALDRATEILNAQSLDFSQDWHDWLFSKALLHEATTLIEGEGSEPQSTDN